MMDLVKAKENNKRGLMIKTWERCRSLGGGSSKSKSKCNNNNNVSGIGRGLVNKGKSWRRLLSESRLLDENYYTITSSNRKGRIAPQGCFLVYVGPQKQRFVIKTEDVNHPLFKVLPEEAESEYGYHTQGPLALPCNVDVFLRVLLEMEDSDHRHHIFHKGGCTFTTTSSSFSSAYRLL